MGRPYITSTLCPPSALIPFYLNNTLKTAIYFNNIHANSIDFRIGKGNNIYLDGIHFDGIFDGIHFDGIHFGTSPFYTMQI